MNFSSSFVIVSLFVLMLLAVAVAAAAVTTDCLYCCRLLCFFVTPSLAWFKCDLFVSWTRAQCTATGMSNSNTFQQLYTKNALKNANSSNGRTERRSAIEGKRERKRGNEKKTHTQIELKSNAAREIQWKQTFKEPKHVRQYVQHVAHVICHYKNTDYTHPSYGAAKEEKNKTVAHKLYLQWARRMKSYDAHCAVFWFKWIDLHIPYFARTHSLGVVNNNSYHIMIAFSSFGGFHERKEN